MICCLLLVDICTHGGTELHHVQGVSRAIEKYILISEHFYLKTSIKDTFYYIKLHVHAYFFSIK